MNDPEAMLSIGEFGRLTWLSPKALRLYERRGLLEPDLVDPFSGYRHYRSAQAERARTIALLRRVGMPLEYIGQVLEADAAERPSLIRAYREDMVWAHERAVALLDSLSPTLSFDALETDDLVVSSRDVAAWSFLARTVRTTASDLPSHIERTVAALSRRAGSSIARSEPFVVMYHGEVSWESDGPIEVRVPIDGAADTDGREPAGRELYVDVPPAQVQFPSILRAFDVVRSAASAAGRHPAGSPREIYLTGSPFRCQVAQRYVTAA